MRKLMRKTKMQLCLTSSAEICLYLFICMITVVTKSLAITQAAIVDGPLVNCIAHDAKYTCDCHNINQHMVLPRLSGFVFHVEISNCKSLTIEANALEETQGLRRITMKNIERLLLKQYALAFPRHASNTPLVIEFEKVNFEVIESHAIDGNIEEISFIRGIIEHIHAFGFKTLKERALLFRMDHVLIKNIEPQAFKKFGVEDLDISNCIFEHNVSSKVFYEVEVLNSLQLYNNKFRFVHSHAFSFRMISKLFIINNYFESVDAEWLEATIRESINIRNNQFGFTSSIAFKGLRVHRDYIREQMELPFVNNSLKLPVGNIRPLEFNEPFTLSLKQLKYENSYSCQWVDFALTPPAPKITFFRLHADSIYFLPQNSKNQSHVVLSQLIQTECQQRSYLWIIIASVVSLLLLFVIAGLVAWFLWSRKPKKRKLDIVLPEPRTYKETQIVYQIENAGLLKTDL